MLSNKRKSYSLQVTVDKTETMEETKLELNPTVLDQDLALRNCYFKHFQRELTDEFSAVELACTDVTTESEISGLSFALIAALRQKSKPVEIIVSAKLQPPHRKKFMSYLAEASAESTNITIIEDTQLPTLKNICADFVNTHNMANTFFAKAVLPIEVQEHVESRLWISESSFEVSEGLNFDDDLADQFKKIFKEHLSDDNITTVVLSCKSVDSNLLKAVMAFGLIEALKKWPTPIQVLVSTDLDEKLQNELLALLHEANQEINDDQNENITIVKESDVLDSLRHIKRPRL